MDVLTPEQRHRNMAAIKSKDTKPEVRVRSMLHKMGFRFRLHAKSLPGRPDIVLPRLRTAVLVHGCFFHSHKGCRYSTTPRTRTDFWQKKFAQNVARDKRDLKELRTLGWRVIVVWECELRNPARLKIRLGRILSRSDY